MRPRRRGRRRLAAAATLAFASLGVAGLVLWAGAPTVACTVVATGVVAVALVLSSLRPARRVALPVAAVALAVVGAVVWPPAAIGSSPSTLSGCRVLEATLGGAPLGAPWLGRIPEGELVRAAAALGLTPTERMAWTAEVQRALLDQIDSLGAPQRVLDSWLFDRRDYLLLLPHGEGPFPLLVFLHGNGGLSAAYVVLLRELSERHRIALALPRLRFGNWSGAVAHARIDAVREQVLAREDVAGDAVLAGLSAGAMGVLRHLARTPQSFAAYVAISGVPFEELRCEPLAGARVTLVHGSGDERVGLAVVRAMADKLIAAGAAVDLQVLEAGHLALLTHRDRVLGALRSAFE